MTEPQLASTPRKPLLNQEMICRVLKLADKKIAFYFLKTFAHADHEKTCACDSQLRVAG